MEDLISASTENARDLAINQLSGEVSKKIKELRARGLGLQKKTLEEEMLEWLESHNKNYNKTQYYKIVTIKEILESIDCGV